VFSRWLAAETNTGVTRPRYPRTSALFECRQQLPGCFIGCLFPARSLNHAAHLPQRACAAELLERQPGGVTANQLK